MLGDRSISPTDLISDDASDVYARLAATGGEPGEEDEGAIRILRSAGLIREDPAKGYTLVDPKYVGAQWEAALHSRVAEILNQAAAVSQALEPLQRAFDGRAETGAGLIELHRGSEAIGWRLGQILGGCTGELLVCQPGTSRRAEMLEEAAPRDVDALRRGVTMCTLYHDQVRTDPAMDAWVARMAGEGAQFRTLDEDFQRMMIIDRRIAVIPGDAILIDHPAAAAYVVNDPGVAGFLARIFERDWDRARAWDDQECSVHLTLRQRAILRGLSKGKTLQQLAPQLGIKQRALGEAIAELKVVFKAKTLFDLACRWKDAQSVQGRS